MNCPSCGAPMQLKADMESYRCDYCHSVYFPDKVEDGVRVLGELSADQACPLCPICSISLVAAAVGGARILYCTKCHGMLVPMGGLEDLVNASRTAAAGGSQAASDPGDLQRKLACPHCRHTMDAHYYAGGGRVIVNSCEACSLIWLDRGGLMRIAHAAGTVTAAPDASAFFDSSEQDDDYAPFTPHIDPTPSLLEDAIGLLQEG